MQLGIALTVPSEVSDFVRDKELYLSEKYHTIGGLKQPPHVTIKWPFEADDIKPFEEYCKDLAARTVPVQIIYDGYGMFDEAFFLKVKSTPELVALHCQILDELKAFGVNKRPFEGPDQQFHTTLAMEDISYEDCVAALQESKSWEVPSPFVSGKLALFRYTGEEWVIHSEYLLG